MSVLDRGAASHDRWMACLYVGRRCPMVLLMHTLYDRDHELELSPPDEVVRLIFTLSPLHVRAWATRGRLAAGCWLTATCWCRCCRGCSRLTWLVEELCCCRLVTAADTDSPVVSGSLVVSGSPGRPVGLAEGVGWQLDTPSSSAVLADGVWWQ